MRSSIDRRGRGLPLKTGMKVKNFTQYALFSTVRSNSYLPPTLSTEKAAIISLSVKDPENQSCPMGSLDHL